MLTFLLSNPDRELVREIMDLLDNIPTIFDPYMTCHALSAVYSSALDRSGYHVKAAAGKKRTNPASFVICHMRVTEVHPGLRRQGKIAIPKQ